MYANSTVQEDKKPLVIDGKIYIHSNNFTHGKSYNQTLQIRVKYIHTITILTIMEHLKVIQKTNCI